MPATGRLEFPVLNGIRIAVTDSAPPVTVLLHRARSGDESARDELLEFVYSELIATARATMNRERDGHSMQATDLLNQAMVKVMDGGVIEKAGDRRYLFGSAHRAMRQILIDHSRKQRTVQLVGAGPEATADWNLRFEQNYGFSVEEFESVLAQLEARSPRQAEALSCRFFSGLTNQQTAEVLGVSVGTVERDLRLARAKLQRDLIWLRSETVMEN